MSELNTEPEKANGKKLSVKGALNRGLNALTDGIVFGIAWLAVFHDKSERKGAKERRRAAQEADEQAQSRNKSNR